MSEQNETGAPSDGGQMTVWDAIRSRRDVRAFDGRPIPPADLDQILESGRRSPSAGNWQPWDFIVVTDRQQLTELAKVWRGGATRMELYAIARPVMFFMGCDGPLCSNLVRQLIDMGDLVPVGDAAVRGAGLRSRFPLAGRGVGSLP
jgi:nitroreductase